jgi:hypothetical protein
VAVQRGGVGLVFQPRPPDVQGGRVVQELFLDGVPVEACDGAQPPARARPRASRSRAKLSMSRTSGKLDRRGAVASIRWRMRPPPPVR